MTLLDPIERTALGRKTQAIVLASPAPEPRTLFDSSWRDYIFAEVWNRPGLDRRSRFLIAIAGAACAMGPTEIIDGYVRGAVSLGDLTLAELCEGALHLATYASWSRGAYLDAAIKRVADALAMDLPPFAPLRSQPWDPAQRLADGASGFDHVMTYPGPPPVTAYFEGGILNFVFAEMWTRPGLDQRSRRWITLVAVAESSSEVPINTHVYSAMASGNASEAEMQEFVLQYAIHGGWPRASVIQGAVFEQAKRLAAGEAFM